MTRDEPLLVVRRPPRPFYLRRRFLRTFGPVASLAVIGFVVLLVAGTLGLPAERLVTMRAKMGSKADYFDDAVVKDLLLRHHMRVEVSHIGSREAATSDYSGFDFLFPSGQAVAGLTTKNKDFKNHFKPFISPLVLATYREYALALAEEGVATPYPDASGYFYELDMSKFVALTQNERTWNDLKIGKHGFANGNVVLAQTSELCTSYGAGAYLGLVSQVVHGRIPRSVEEARAFAEKIKQLHRSQGLESSAATENYFVDEGRGIAPIIVMYEHQYLARQAQRVESGKGLDEQRVLLYPDTSIYTKPELITLTDDGDRLGHIVAEEPAFKQRAMELGFRVLDKEGVYSSERLAAFLAERGIPNPMIRRDETEAVPLDSQLQEEMIRVVGGCA
ncbi:hypothetical protein [Alloactinosynnema sp. L-07]|uniref:hypothetical protein n=1 Tax=Alloactinosynnema sp. L-07 TaxID=1653480 RepID=UPI00065EF8A3|nr:hypothetical protein [Alloactinosynnema sp. L-07]CRK59472.1 hypothetical protein [Alloactinosynnema sp. L-07]